MGAMAGSLRAVNIMGMMSLKMFGCPFNQLPREPKNRTTLLSQKHHHPEFNTGTIPVGIIVGLNFVAWEAKIIL